MKNVQLLFALFSICLATPLFSYAEDANDPLYEWQLDEFGKLRKAYAPEIEKQMNNDPSIGNYEELYLWQLNETPNIFKAYDAQIQAQLVGFHEFPNKMTPQENLEWQRREFKNINNAYGEEFEKSALQSQKLKELKEARTQ